MSNARRPILFRHLVFGTIDQDRPVFFHTPGGATATAPWTTRPSGDRKGLEAGDEVMRLIWKHCEVMDLVNHGLDFLDVIEQWRKGLNPLRSLPKARVIRCFASRGFEFPVDTAIDFALAGWGQNWHYCPLPVRCNRYVVAKVRPQHFSRLQLERVRRVTEVIIHCVSNKGQPPLWAINVFRKLPLRVHITLVGLATPSGDTSGDKVQQYFESRVVDKYSWPPEDFQKKITFLSAMEYRQLVGEERYLLETDKDASIF